MPLILVAEYQFRDADTSHPWMVILNDDSEEAEEYVVLSDDPAEASYDGEYQTNEGGIHDAVECGFDANFDPPPLDPTYSVADVPVYPLCDLSVVSPGGCTAPNPEQPQRTHSIRSFEQLDHGNHEEAMTHRHLVPPERYLRLRTGLRKIDAYPNRFARPDDRYQENLSVIALSGWDAATRYSLCGIKNALRRSQPCRLWNICPSCSYWRRKKPTLSAYLTRFRRTSWYFVTISYVVELGNGILDEEVVRVCWRAAADALRAHQHAGFSRGAMSRLEMHLERFLPLQYLAHLHAIVDADRIDQQFLADQVFAYRHPGTQERITFPASICDRPLRSERSFANALSYTGKAIDLAAAYRAAWPDAERDQRRLAPSLNQEVDEFLDAFSAFTSDTHQVRYSGTMHVGSRDSLRIPRAQQAAQRDLVSSILTDCGLDPWDDDDTETCNLFMPPAL